MARKLILTHRRAPGDTLVLTGLVRDLALARPGEFDVYVDTHASSLWLNNPHCRTIGHLGHSPANGPGVLRHRACYGKGIRQHKHETVHFLAWFHRDLAENMGIEVPVLMPHPDLHLSAEEKRPAVEGRYWLLNAGGKTDFPAKIWSAAAFQRVVDMLRERGIACVQAGSTSPGPPAHWHPKLERVVDLVGKTDLRGYLGLLHNSDGVVTGISFPMHAAAALNRPCVVLAGGREAWWWEAYHPSNKGFGPRVDWAGRIPHRFLHTIGLLDCCAHVGCWKKKVLPSPGETSVCVYPETDSGQTLARCLAMITPEMVVEAVMSHYTDRSLPPITPDPKWLTDQPKAPEPAPLVPVVVSAPQPAVVVAERPAIRLEVPAGPTYAPAHDPEAFDHPAVGGKFTVFGLLYGDFHDMHRECLTTFLRTAPPDRFELRLGSNQLGAKSLRLVEELEAAGQVAAHYRHEKNDRKYPVMREMFHDPNRPIATEYLIWFDDDTIFDRNPDWMRKMAGHIAAHHPDGFRLFGPRYTWQLKPGQVDWYRQAPWYKGRPFRNSAGRGVPGGSKIVFATGSFWALATHVVRQQDIPDVRLAHNGGDVCIGEQSWQGGWDIKSFTSQKQDVRWSAYKRRGLSEAHPGT